MVHGAEIIDEAVRVDVKDRGDQSDCPSYSCRAGRARFIHTQFNQVCAPKGQDDQEDQCQTSVQAVCDPVEVPEQFKIRPLRFLHVGHAFCLDSLSTACSVAHIAAQCRTEPKIDQWG
ncbi:hypothetical protein SDC9_168158 [bioreactor metagenome]|uniref:Uncharacterized protein n=1 Tax=bioreactor metagenome TaxID=1076179 RepID=A0A645G4R7_9ZZZZ